MAARLLQLPSNTIIIHGACKGADIMAERAAKFLEFDIKSYPVSHEEWRREGKRAGINRNEFMLNDAKPQLILAFHEDLKNSVGTADMIKRAKINKIEWELIE
jgi:hypothetical protein